MAEVRYFQIKAGVRPCIRLCTRTPTPLLQRARIARTNLFKLVAYFFFLSEGCKKTKRVTCKS